MDRRQAYKIFGVESIKSLDELKEIYHKLALKNNSDKMEILKKCKI